jgi:hypothetical protein
VVPDGNDPILTRHSKLFPILAPARGKAGIIARTIRPDQAEVDAPGDDFVEVQFMVVADADHRSAVW